MSSLDVTGIQQKGWNKVEVSQPAPPPDPRPAFWQPKMKEEPLRPQFSSALDMMFFGSMAKLLLMMMLMMLLLMMMMMMLLLMMMMMMMLMMLLLMMMTMMMMIKNMFRKGKHPFVGIGKIEKMGSILVEHTSRVGHFVYNVVTGKPGSPSENVSWERRFYAFRFGENRRPNRSSLTIVIFDA